MSSKPLIFLLVPFMYSKILLVLPHTTLLTFLPNPQHFPTSLFFVYIRFFHHFPYFLKMKILSKNFSVTHLVFLQICATLNI